MSAIKHCILVSALAFTAHGVAYAQSATPQAAGASVVYGPDFFEVFAPRTAFDMVSRVPGFILNEGEDRRGLSGASGNVRIDGAQPSAKSETLEEILTRIPAREVARIELVRGESSGASGGQTTYVNIVRASVDAQTVWTLGTEIDRYHRIAPRGDATWSRPVGEGMVTLRGVYLGARETERGPRARFDNAGNLISQYFHFGPSREKTYTLSGEWKTPFAGGDLSLTAQAQHASDKEPTYGNNVNGAGALIDFRDGVLLEFVDTYEGGLTYGRQLGEWKLDLNGVVTREGTEGVDTEYALNPAGAVLSGRAQNRFIDTGESIARGVLSRPFGTASVQVGVEGAINTLDQRLTLVQDNGAGPFPVVLPSANVRVEERRAEAFTTLSFTPLTDWKVEATAAAETSTLTQVGDVNLETKLTYWKPSLQVVRSLGEKNQLRARLYRDIGQLNFNDFVAASQVADGSVSAGNPDLKPQTSWRLEGVGDLRFGANGAFALKVFRWWVDDALDQIPFGPAGARFDAPGNIGKADVYGATVSFTVPLSSFLPGAQLSGETTFQKSEVTDPLTGTRRPLSNFKEGTGQVTFRQDLPELSFAWGGRYSEDFDVAPTYRVREVRRQDGNQRFEVYVEVHGDRAAEAARLCPQIPGTAGL